MPFTTPRIIIGEVPFLRPNCWYNLSSRVATSARFTERLVPSADTEVISESLDAKNVSITSISAWIEAALRDIAPVYTPETGLLLLVYLVLVQVINNKPQLESRGRVPTISYSLDSPQAVQVGGKILLLLNHPRNLIPPLVPL